MQLNQESTDYLDWFREKIVAMVRRRIEEGATKYGDLLPAEHDDRDFAAEALEELVDAVFYVQRLGLQRRYLVNENQRLMAKLAKVRADLASMEEGAKKAAEAPNKPTLKIKTTGAQEGFKANPLYVETKSRRMQLLVRPSLYEAIKARATTEGTSVNELVHSILEAAIKGEE